MERQYEPEFTKIQPVFVPNPVPPSSRLIMELKTPIIYGKKVYFIKLIINISKNYLHTNVTRKKLIHYDKLARPMKSCHSREICITGKVFSYIFFNGKYSGTLLLTSVFDKSIVYFMLEANFKSKDKQFLKFHESQISYIERNSILKTFST